MIKTTSNKTQFQNLGNIINKFPAIFYACFIFYCAYVKYININTFINIFTKNKVYCAHLFQNESVLHLNLTELVENLVGIHVAGHYSFFTLEYNNQETLQNKNNLTLYSSRDFILFGLLI